MNRNLVNILHSSGFNCFPIRKGEKIADSRYNASNTIPNQTINDEDNFGYIPIKGAGTSIIDFDSDKYTNHLHEYAVKFMVIKTPHGYHLPVKGLSGTVNKVELFDYEIQDNKIVEIQGQNHYCVGPSSVLKDGSEYKNIGTDNIFDVNGLDFHDFINKTCITFNLTGRKKSGSSYQHIRKRFELGLPPNKGQSNDYFNQAALVCNTEGLSIEEAEEKILIIYEKWKKSDSYSGRPWSNIIQKINEVYDNDLKIFHGGHRKQNNNIDEIVSDILNKYKLYSDKETDTIYEETNGFVKIVNNIIKNRIVKEHNTDRHSTSEIMAKLMALSEDLPKTDNDIIIFKNGYYRISTHHFHEHDDNHGLAIMGFEGYDFKDKPECPKFEKFMNDTFPDENMRNGAYVAASCCVVPEHQERITMCYGPAGTGKTTFREILLYSIGKDYSISVDSNGIFNDMFGLADWENKTYISLGEAPKTLKEFDKLKRITGDSNLVIRKMHSSPISVPNHTKIIMDTNNLFKVPEDEAGPMFDRLHLLEFTERFRYTENDIKKLSRKIADEEGEDIISMLLMTYSQDNEYPTPKETKTRWEDISIPEKSLFKKLFEYKKDDEGLPQMEVKVTMEENSGIEVDMNIVRKLCKDAGYSLTNGNYKGLVKKSLTENLEKFS